MKILIQKCISREVDIASRGAKAGIETIDIGERPDAEQLSALDGRAVRDLLPSPVFCSLQVGRTIQRSFPALARGLDMPLGFLRHGHYTSLLPPEVLLNGEGIYLPWSRVASRGAMLRDLFGQSIFLRPDSAAKPFTGFVTSIGDLAFEISAHSQTDHVRPEEMIFVAPARRLPEHEFRVWIVDGMPVTSASYSWDGAAERLSTPMGVIDMARDVARLLERECTNFVADFVLINGAVKLIELNAISTSGWYRGMDPAILLSAVLRNLD